MEKRETLISFRYTLTPVSCESATGGKSWKLVSFWLNSNIILQRNNHNNRTLLLFFYTRVSHLNYTGPRHLAGENSSLFILLYRTFRMAYNNNTAAAAAGKGLYYYIGCCVFNPPRKRIWCCAVYILRGDLLAYPLANVLSAAAII